MAHRIQLTIDSNHAYFEVVDGAFGSDIDYGMLMKMTVPKVVVLKVDTAPEVS